MELLSPGPRFVQNFDWHDFNDVGADRLRRARPSRNADDARAVVSRRPDNSGAERAVILIIGGVSGMCQDVVANHRAGIVAVHGSDQIRVGIVYAGIHDGDDDLRLRLLKTPGNIGMDQRQRVLPGKQRVIRRWEVEAVNDIVRLGICHRPIPGSISPPLLLPSNRATGAGDTGARKAHNR